jgi:hypothetical protein
MQFRIGRDVSHYMRNIFAPMSRVRSFDYDTTRAM